MNYIVIISVVISSILITSCKTESVGDVINRLKANQVIHVKEAGNHQLEFRMIPEELYFLQYGKSIDTSIKFTENLFDSIKSESGSEYGLMFSFTLGPKNFDKTSSYRNDVIYGQISGNLDYRKTLDKYLFGLKEHVWLEMDGIKYPLYNYQMVRNFGMTRHRTFMMMYPGIKAKKGKKIAMVVDGLVPGLGREKFEWVL